MTIPPDQVMIRCGSHRAREHLFRLLPVQPKGHWSWDRHATGGFYLIPKSMLKSAREIKGVTKAKDVDDLRECISWT